MNGKQEILDVLTGSTKHRIPWVPRLDLWYRANRLAGTLPSRYRRASLIEIIDDLGWGFHAVIPDFQDLRSPEDDVDRALGIYNLSNMPIRTVLENIERRVTIHGDRTRVEYHTPAGNIVTETVYDDPMRKAGITITHVSRYAFQSPDDYAPLMHIFRNARVEPNYEGYSAWAETIGARGFATAYVNSSASPMHLIQRELMPLQTFFFEMHDRPDEMAELSACVACYWKRMIEAARRCPAEVFMLGANYDAAIQHPGFFGEHITPWLADFADQLHGQGKFLLTHTDGENRGLLLHYAAAGFDIADSICPSPMTRLSLAEVRQVLTPAGITIMGGVPSVALIRESMNDVQFESYLDEFFTQIDCGNRLILGISDTTPPAAEFSRLTKIAERIEEFGPVCCNL